MGGLFLAHDNFTAGIKIPALHFVCCVIVM